jgi:tripartite-type tricarboxylate transporter receptor subunit TctC
MNAIERAMRIVAAVALSFAATEASSQNYPNQPIKLIHPYAAGGGPDIILRAFARSFAGNDWPNLVIENRPGGTGTIAAIATKRAEPDGYTLMAADTTSHALAVSLVGNLPYDPVKDFTPISMLFNFSALLAVPASSPAASVAEFAELAKQKPGGLTYASQGNGSSGHVLGVLFEKAVGVPIRHVPYRGAAPAMPDLLTGRVDFIFSSRGSLQSYIDSGQLRILATTSPNNEGSVPSLSQVGFPSVTLLAWFGLVGPANLPSAVSTKLHERTVNTLNLPEVVEMMKKNGVGPYPTSPDQMRNIIESDIKRLGAIGPDLARSTN